MQTTTSTRTELHTTENKPLSLTKSSICLLPLVVCTAPNLRPRCEGIAHPLQWCSQFREMSTQYLLHPIILHPSERLGRVNRAILVIELRGNKSIALQSPTCHEDKYTKCCIAETEPLGQRLTETTNKEINLLHVIFVDGDQFLQELGAILANKIGDRFPGSHMEKAAELVVAGDAAFTVTDDVNSAHVEVAAVGGV